MAKALVIFGSTTGNTESAATTIANGLAEKNIATTVQEVTSVEKSDFSDDYDIILLGSSTWGDEDIEFQEDFAEFYETMDDLPLSGKKLAVFGCGDSSYTHFCGAVDALEQKAESMGAKLVVSCLKIDGDPDDAQDDIVEWTDSVAASI